MARPAAPHGQRSALVAVLVLTEIALALRLAGLNSPLWYDEMATVARQLRGGLGEVLSSFVSNNNHPFFTLLAKLSILAFGESPWSVRLPAVLFGTAAVPALYVFATRVADRRTALLAAAMMAVSYHAVWFSQNARGYTILLFLTIVATTALLDAVVGRRSPGRNYALYALAMALASYTHLTMVLVAVAHAFCVLAYLLAARRGPGLAGEAGRAALAFVAAAVLTLAFYAPMLGEVIRFFVEGTTSESTGTAARVASARWAVGAAITEVVTMYGGLLLSLLVLACLAVGGILLAVRRPFAAALVVLPVPVIVLTTVGLGRPIFPRFFFCLAGFFLVAASYGIFALADLAGRVLGGRARPAVAAGLAIAVMAALGYGNLRNWNLPKQDFDGGYAAARALHPDLPAIALGMNTELALNLYRDHALPVIRSAEDFRATAATTGDFVVIYSFARYIREGQPELWAAMTAACEPIASRPSTVAGGEVDVALCRP